MAKRLQGRRLMRFKALHLTEHPLCVMCQSNGRVTLATELDHIVALSNGGPDFDIDPSNAQGLCRECHDAKTRRDLGIRERVTIGTDGWPIG